MPFDDPRIYPVEDNLMYFARTVRDLDWIIDRSTPNVLAYSSDVAFPMCNVVTGAALVGEPGAMARQVAGEFISRRLPWMWWTTPSHTSSELEAALNEIGLEREDTPGMYVDLDSLPRVDDSCEIVSVAADDSDYGQVLVEGFGLSAFVRDPWQEVMGVFSDEELVNLVARVDGRAVGVGSGLITEETLGIYNIVTLEDARGRGVGTAVTSALMQMGKERGATHAILHSSAMGHPVYGRLGFEVVCPTTQWMWMPTK